ncbi:unnamed protein product [Rhizophagus irregularis]|nr:unnamed protein product [Rhizophagus irregularis]
MEDLENKIVELFLDSTLEAICSATVIYLLMEGASLPTYDHVLQLTRRAVDTSLPKITDNERKLKVSEVLSQMDIGYKSIVGLNAIKVLKEQEPLPDNTREEINRNLRALQSKLGAAVTKADIPLYSDIKQNLANIDVSKLTWQDPVASMVISDDSMLVRNLSDAQIRTFVEPREKMKCNPLPEVESMCDEFVNNFNKIDNLNTLGVIKHDNRWKEGVDQLTERTNHILSVLGEIWNNPAFASSEIRSNQSKGTYIMDVIVPLLRASLGALPNNNNICLSTAERQSIASKARRNFEKDKVQGSQSSKTRLGKKPDVMVITKSGGKYFEVVFAESSRVTCTDIKKAKDSVKLWREVLDGLSFVGAACRPENNQFGIVGIQVAGENLYLNVLIKDASGIPRYFHLGNAEIPFTNGTPWRVKPLVHLLLTLRNIIIVIEAY